MIDSKFQKHNTDYQYCDGDGSLIINWFFHEYSRSAERFPCVSMCLCSQLRTSTANTMFFLLFFLFLPFTFLSFHRLSLPQEWSPLSLLAPPCAISRPQCSNAHWRRTQKAPAGTWAQSFPVLSSTMAALCDWTAAAPPSSTSPVSQWLSTRWLAAGQVNVKYTWSFYVYKYLYSTMEY